MSQQLSLFRSWSSDVVEIKELLRNRKFKRCAARCQEIQATAFDPIHQTFLAFYQALCYESIGISAHMYSTNKLPMLNLAKDCFGLALEYLPQALHIQQQRDLRDPNCLFASDSQQSPACATLEIFQRYQFASPGTVDEDNVSPCDSGFGSGVADADSDNGRSEDCPLSVSDTKASDHPVGDGVPDFNDYSPRRDTHVESFRSQRPSTQTQTQKLQATAPGTSAATPSPFPRITRTGASTSNHKARLSQSLSATHCLADELVPSPLFNRNRHLNFILDSTPSKLQTVTKSDLSSLQQAEGHKQNHEHSELADNNDTKDPANKPLPALPFNHKPHFQKRGSRHVLVPISANANSVDSPRRSAIETLVAKFEGKIKEQQQYSSVNQSSALSPRSIRSLTLSPKTPVTPRFAVIRQTFTVREDPKSESQSARTEVTKAPNNMSSTPAPTSVPRRHGLEVVSQSKQNPATPLTARFYNPRILSEHDPKEPQPNTDNQPPFTFFNTPSSLFSSRSTLSSDYRQSQTHLSNINFNLALTSFRSSLHDHLHNITSRIAAVTKAQEERRARGVTRDMSFWSFDAAQTANGDVVAPSVEVEKRRGAQERERWRR